MSFYRKTTLPSGLRVITEAIPHVRSASIGIWVEAGSCLERPEEMGVSHLIEHMLFKGTERRNARQIAQEIDSRGGALNAFTSKEHTCYYVKVLDEHVPVAIDLLADMLRHSRFDPEELDRERGVIIEEIKMYEDLPDDLVHDLFATAIWREHALGRPIVGREETVQGMERAAILDYYKRHYSPGNLVVSAAGRVDHDQVVDLVAKAFGERPHGEGATAPASAAPVPAGGLAWPEHPAKPTSSRAVLRAKEIEQSHLILGMTGLPQEHGQNYALFLLNTILGGGASSRLFQEIREERGLAYSVYSFYQGFKGTGSFAIYAGVSPKMAAPVLDLTYSMLDDVGRNGVTAQELHEAKEQLKGQLMLGLESTSSRMTRLGRGELSLGRVLSPDQVIQRIEAVSLEQVAELAHRLFREEPRFLSAVGPRPDELNLSNFGFEEVYHG